MQNVSNDYIGKIYGDFRQVEARVTIEMEEFDPNPTVINDTATFVNKVSGSTSENPNIYMLASKETLIAPNALDWYEPPTASYLPLNTLNGAVSSVDAVIRVNNIAQQIFSFDVIRLLSDRHGTAIFANQTTQEEKVAKAKEWISQATINWHGKGSNPNKFAGVRFIRDWLNGNTVNANNYWNEIRAYAGATNVAQGKTPTSNGTLTNPLNITDGTASTYGYETANTGAKWVQVDLGSIRTDIEQIQVIHYYLDGRTHHGTKTEISTDGTTWTVLRDSAVSGEYAETSTGQKFAPAVSNKANTATWNGTSWNAPVFHTNNTIARNQFIVTDLSTLINSAGMIHILAYSSAGNATYASNIQTDYVELILEGIIDNRTRIYDGETIVRMKILEEVSTINETLPANELQLTMDNTSGDFDILTFTRMPEILATKPTIFCELGLVLNETTTEWIPMGKFIITEWKADVTTKVISFVAHDYFMIFGDTNYEPKGITNLYDLAKDVLSTVGIPDEDQLVDFDQLSPITTNGFSERLDCRTALQHIGICGIATVFQDRLGNVNIKPFQTIQQSAKNLLYTRTQPALIGGFAGNNVYSVISTGGGMLYIDTDYMYDYPDVMLERSPFQVAVKVYYTPNDPDPAEVIYTQGAEGSSGISFTIDNPLVNSTDIADKIIQWYFNELSYNAIYIFNWRHNPALECTDIVLVEDAYQANKQTRIYRQEFSFEGWLEGSSESRGGV
jgi:hypothetical protein